MVIVIGVAHLMVDEARRVRLLIRTAGKPEKAQIRCGNWKVRLIW